MKAIFKSKVFNINKIGDVEYFVNNNTAEIKVVSVTEMDDEITLWYYEYEYKK